MIGAVAVIAGKPGTGPQLEAALQQLAAATHAEDGCLLYSLQRGRAEPDTFVTIEKWRSQDDLDAHLGSAHVQSAIGAAMELLARDLLVIPLDAVATDEAKGTF